ncbi:MAG: site-specific integrase [Planctomycetia bacterium]|nr:site-specific integrase [Planctomycetia bacterium]
MPRKKSAVPSYKLHKASGQARVIVKGQHVYLGPFGSDESRERYARLLAKFRADPQASVQNLDSTVQLTPQDFTVNEVILRYWKHAEGYYRTRDGRPSSELCCIKESVRRLRMLYGRTRADEFGPKSLKAVRQHMIDEGLSRRVINGYVGRIRRVFKWAVAEELIPASVYHGLLAVDGLRANRSEARETCRIKPVPESRVNAVLARVAPQIAAMIQFQLLTGCRPGEVCILRGCDIDMTGRVWVFRPSRHKTEHHDLERWVYIGPKAQAVIRPWLRTELQAHLFQPSEAESIRNSKRRQNRQSPMTPSQAARKPKKKREKAPRDHYDVGSYRRAIKRGCELAFQIPDELRKISKKTPEPARSELRRQAAAWRKEHCWHPNQLRHSAATRLRKEHGVEMARIILGHTTAFTTEIYAEVDQQQAIEVIAKVG